MRAVAAPDRGTRPERQRLYRAPRPRARAVALGRAFTLQRIPPRALTGEAGRRRSSDTRRWRKGARRKPRSLLLGERRAGRYRPPVFTSVSERLAVAVSCYGRFRESPRPPKRAGVSPAET